MTNWEEMYMKKVNKKKSVWFLIIGIVFLVSGFSFIPDSISEAFVAMIIGVILIYIWYPKNSNLNEKVKSVSQKQVSAKPATSVDLSQGRYDVDRLWEIVNESLSIVTTTVNPDTFFSRYSLILEMLEKIIMQEGRNNTAVVEELEKLKQSKPIYVDSFIDKMWNDTCKKMGELKTERGKINRVIKFKEELKKYENEMTAENIQRYTNKQY